MRRSVKLALVGVLVAGLGACARSGPPAPVVMGGTAAPAASASRATSGEPIAAGGTYVVRPGDTIFTISRRSGVPTRALIDANRLSPPYALETGTRLSIPAVRIHEVRAGDTTSQIARRYGVPLRELVRVNAIEPPYVIRVGQRLAIPDATVVAATTPSSIPTVMVPAEPPSRGTPAPRGTVEAAPLPPPAASPAAPQVSQPPSVQASQQATAVPPPANPPAAAPDAGARAGSGRMLWPVRGVIVSDYGPKPGGLQNDGINIAAPRGTAFRAAESGVVIYAGNELRGFGNLLLLRHEGGYVTAYAHADELAVRRGDQVRKGQTIGRVGSSGNVTGPQLHFEVRRGTQAVNPVDYLGSQSSASN